MLRRPTHSELSEIMSHVYLFSHVYVFLYVLNYITSLYWKLSENYKHGRRNDQPICQNKGRNESNELNSNNLRFFRNNLGLVFHTTYSCIFHSCIFSRLQVTPKDTPSNYKICTELCRQLSGMWLFALGKN